jgi:cytoskeleton protein RodZ
MNPRAGEEYSMHKVFSLGAQLAAAREERNLPLEKAAHDTRIRAQRLREIENDDLSHFPHPSYARMFLIDYAKYLGIPLSDIRDLLPASGVAGSEGYQYLRESEERVIYRSIRPMRQRRLVPVLLGVVAAIVIVVGGFELFITWRKLDRLELSKALAPIKTEVQAPIVAEAPVAPAPAPAPTPESEKTPAVFVAPNIGAPVAIDEAVISSDESALNAASVSETPAEAAATPAPAPAPTPVAPPVANSLPDSQAPVSPLFVGGTVEHSGSVQ